MLGLKATTGQAVDELIKATVRARNAKDWGAYSEFNVVGATIEDIPA